GVRMALGAQFSDVIKLILGSAAKMTAIGLLIGIPLAIGLSYVMSHLLVGIVRPDVGTFVELTITLAVIALVASYIPARKASSVDPLVSLRAD
ncbi:MAG TPA: FtsX-like permease family protein, partial [Blastocatellia bacterium]|nr:FtsX-like permease family protein [Blastocatellia bacterium]